MIISAVHVYSFTSKTAKIYPFCQICSLYTLARSKAIRPVSMPSSQAADPLTNFNRSHAHTVHVHLRLIVDVLAPFITELFNRSIQAGHFPTTFKEAFITPIVKKPGLDAASRPYKLVSADLESGCLIEAPGASRC